MVARVEVDGGKRGEEEEEEEGGEGCGGNGVGRREVLSWMVAGGFGVGVPKQADARFLGEIFKGEGKDVFQRTSFIYDVKPSGLSELVSLLGFTFLVQMFRWWCWWGLVLTADLPLRA